jgi:hypothetical protein
MFYNYLFFSKVNYFLSTLTSENFTAEIPKTSASIPSPSVINMSWEGHSRSFAITPIKIITAAKL